MADFPLTDHTAVVEVFSTITSPVFSELVIILTGRPSLYLPQEALLFETLRVMNEAVPFESVFLLEVLDPFQEEAHQGLVRAFDIATANGLLTFVKSPPTICIARSHGFPPL